MSGRTEILSRLLPLYAVIFAGFVGYSLMITVFTPLLLHGTGGLLPPTTSASTRSLILGGLLALYPLGQFFTSPVLGSLSDRLGRRPVLIASLSITTGCYVLIVWALHAAWLWLLAVACLAAGMAESNIVSAQGAIADLTRPEERERYFGYIYLSASLAYVVGPLIGGKLAEPSLAPGFGAPLPFAVVCLLLAGTTAVIALRFRDARAGTGQTGRTGNALTALSIVVRPDLRRVFGINFLLYLAAFGFFRSYPMFLAQALHLGVSRISEFIAWVGVPIVLVNLGVTGYVAQRVDPPRLALFSAIGTGVFVAAVALVPGRIWLWPTLFLAGAGIALLLPACAMLLSEEARPEEQGQAMGGNQSLQVGAEALSGALAGVLAAIAVRLPLPAMGLFALLAAALLALHVNSVTSTKSEPLAP